MEALVQELFTAGLAALTQKAYRAGEWRYIFFCSLIQAYPYSVSKHQLSKFLAFMYQEWLSTRTIKNYLAAMRHAQIALGLGDPVMVRMRHLQYVLKGAHWRLAGRVKRARMPITPEILQRLRKSWERFPVRADASVLWAAATLCFFDFLHTGEAVAPSDAGFDARYHLAYGDMRVNRIQNPLWTKDHIKQSKCNQLAGGIKLVIRATGSNLCPVAAMLGS